MFYHDNIVRDCWYEIEQWIYGSFDSNKILNKNHLQWIELRSDQ